MEQAYGGQWPKAEHYPDPYLVPALDPIHASHFQSRSVGTSNVIITFKVNILDLS